MKAKIAAIKKALAKTKFPEKRKALVAQLKAIKKVVALRKALKRLVSVAKSVSTLSVVDILQYYGVVKNKIRNNSCSNRDSNLNLDIQIVM